MENRTGAGGRLGVEYVKQAEPDGLTMLFVPDFVMTIFPHSYRKLGYVPTQDFLPVALCATTSYAIAAGPGLPSSVTSVQQFVDWCKANPKAAAIGNTSAGSPTHFVAVMLAKKAGIQVVHVSYKGGAPALQDLIGGQVPVSINPIGEVLPFVKSGRLRILATTGARRSDFLPDVPTVQESGWRELETDAWLGVLLPRGVPSERVAATGDLINRALSRPDVKEAYSAFGLATAKSSPALMAEAIKSQTAKWAEVVRASGFVAED